VAAWPATKARRVLAALERAFMLSYLIATLFDDIREVGAGLAKYYAG
jgi:hypothetical protein